MSQHTGIMSREHRGAHPRIDQLPEGEETFTQPTFHLRSISNRDFFVDKK
jgi:hypothetical protein